MPTVTYQYVYFASGPLCASRQGLPAARVDLLSSKLRLVLRSRAEISLARALSQEAGRLGSIRFRSRS